MTTDYLYGFRIVGRTSEPRRLIDAVAGFAAYAATDDRAQIEREAYLSAFQFAGDFADYLQRQQSVAGFAGPCWGQWVWFDLDAADDLQRAQRDAARLAFALQERYGVSDDELLLFFSGGKGFHVGLPTVIWEPQPGPLFNQTARRFAGALVDQIDVRIDSGVYDKVRPFRAPNSRHPKTGLHKRRLTLDELTRQPIGAIVDLASKPLAFDLPDVRTRSDQAGDDWQAALAFVQTAALSRIAQRAEHGAKLNRATLDYIRNGATEGDRHRMLFSAAANLAEFGCSTELATALLFDAARDTGLPPKEIHRQIECGLKASQPISTAQDQPETTLSTPNGSTVANARNSECGDSGERERHSCQQVTSDAGSNAELAKRWQRAQQPKGVPQ